MTDTGALYTWGSGIFGQLGLGDTESRLSPSLVSGLYPPFLSLVCVLYSCLLAYSHTRILSHCPLPPYSHPRLRTYLSLAFSHAPHVYAHMLAFTHSACLHTPALHAPYLHTR